jgi:hypothetical protein
MNLKIFILFIILSNFGLSQNGIGLLYEEMPNDSILPNSLSNHTSIKPQIRIFNNTTLSPSKFFYSKETINDSICRSFTISPILDLGLASGVYGSYRTGIGATFTVDLNEKWYAKISVIEGIGETYSTIFSPKAFYFKKTSNTNYNYTDIRGRISYTPNHIFNFQAGIDHNFIGEGNRSMLLSDYSKPYPFVQIRSTFGRFEYMMLYEFLKEKSATSDVFKSKYSSSHLISYNITKKLNIGIFESVIFSPKDTTLNRGYDAEYLNPAVFFRPQEYSLGSPDNILLGFQASAKYEKHTLYTQVLLDEFLLSELKAKSRWWANKYGGQIGVKGRFTNMNQNYFYRLEMNFARPYTYSHASLSQNYGNQGYSLAHPLGANFYEFLAELKWQSKKWNVKSFLSYYLKGIEKYDGYSYGSDIYLSYNLHKKDYNNKIGNGTKVNGVHLIVTTSYLIENKNNLQIFLENHLTGSTISKEPSYQFVIGIRSCLWNDYRNY